MTIRKRNIRGLQDIGTLAGRVDQVVLPHKAYLRVACLEMEKARRGKERESAARRIENIDARFQEIDAEEAALLEGLKGRGGATVSAAARSQTSAPQPPSRGMTRVLRLRY
jgi:hypothetical protein